MWTRWKHQRGLVNPRKGFQRPNSVLQMQMWYKLNLQLQGYTVEHWMVMLRKNREIEEGEVNAIILQQGEVWV